jgi:hypothetical protein
MFRTIITPILGALDCVYSLWSNAPTILPAGGLVKEEHRFPASGMWRRLPGLSTVDYLRNSCALISKNLELRSPESLSENYYGPSKSRQPITK